MAASSILSGAKTLPPKKPCVKAAKIRSSVTSLPFFGKVKSTYHAVVAMYSTSVDDTDLVVHFPRVLEGENGRNGDHNANHAPGAHHMRWDHFYQRILLWVLDE
ncbi:hypothetical protein N0V92_010619 [Colletotrichum tropicale]|nr:hypothetical protein N0V92_010619 [Colletotrichum tropicale]